MNPHAPQAITQPPPLPPAPPAPAACRPTNDPASTFAVVAGLGAAFAGFVTYGRNPDPLATAMMVGCTFFILLAGLFVLHIVYRLAISVTKVALPVALVLLVGCALDWHWAERAVHWLRVAAHQGVVAVERGWSAVER